MFLNDSSSLRDGAKNWYFLMYCTISQKVSQIQAKLGGEVGYVIRTNEIYFGKDTDPRMK